MVSTVNASSVVGKAQRVERAERKIVAVERLGRRPQEIRIRKIGAQNLLIDTALRGKLPINVKSLRGSGLHQQVEHAIGRPRIERDQLILRRPQSDIRNAAQVEHRDRRFQARCPGPGEVVERRERRTFSTRRNVGAAEVVDYRDARLGRQPARIAQLNRPAANAIARSLMQDRLAVHPHQIEV